MNSAESPARYGGTFERPEISTDGKAVGRVPTGDGHPGARQIL